MLKNSMMGHQILVSASACCTVEQEVKEESTTVIAELSAELQREKQKNAELMERISVLESQVQAKQKVLELTNGKASCQSMEKRHFRKLKKQKVAQYIETNEDRKEKVVSEVKDHTENFLTKDVNTEKCLVNWMSMDDTQFLIFERSKDSDSAADNDSNDSEDEDDEESDDIGIYDDDIHREKVKNLPIKKEIKEQVLNEDLGEASDPAFLETRNNLETSLAQTCLKHNVTSNTRGHDNCNNKDIKMLESCEEPLIACQIDHGIKIQRNPFPQKKSLKVAFCPKEVKKILGSRELSLENAQSHTMRKIIVFSPFGTRHGCEDMYELDFNHFSILHKGQSYIDLNNPGEHVLYHNPGIRRKIFFPNRQNPTLCPVQILEEEKTMRPTDASCPSWLFLCIKYGGRTRNLPQNEYVRQRMGRNKLKSFGPVICRMAMLVHIRSGSFFFKALGITLLFMAGFSNDLVQRETKYRNLDLLQKYYRRDEDAEREELFLSHSETDTTNISPNTQHAKKVSTKSKRKSEAISKSKPSQEVTMIPSQPSCSASPAPFGLMNYASSPSQMTVSVPSSQTLADMQKPVMANAAFNIPYHNQCSYPLFPMHPPNSAVPFAYWPQLNAFPPFPHPSSPHPSFYRYLTPGSCISVHPYSYYSHLSFNPLIPETLGTEKQNERSDKAERDSSSSSSSTDSRKK